ncbi:conserved domain protein [Lachnospiraceae bacterium KM106-2]|nr:conserved domain protein [Lachnospiraceae bacterium KM106-2]
MKKWKQYSSIVLTIILVILMVTPVTTKAAAVQSVKFTQSISQLDVGMEYTFAAQKKGIKKSIRFSVSDKKKASINAKTGAFLAKKCGLVKVIAKAGNKKVTKRVLIVGNNVTVTQKHYSKVYKLKKKTYCTITATYPTIAGKDKGIKAVNTAILKSFNTWKKQHSGFLSEAKASVKEQPDVIYGDDASFQITYNRNGFVNILCKGYEYRGGAHGMPYRRNEFYNVKTGRKLDLTDIKSGSSDAIKKEIVTAYSKLINKQPDIYWDNALETVEETSLDQFRWYVTEDGIVIYFDPYELAAYAQGFVEVTIPMN